MPEAKLYCGTSGFAYPSWKPSFYPAKLPSTKFLPYYATRLNAVEVNYTYRRFASRTTFDKWLSETPENFIFLPKAHMKITHVLKLEGAEELTRAFLETLEPLRSAGRLGPILFQLAPSFKMDADRLRHFVRLLPRTDRAAFEFRSATWFDDDIYTVLKDSNLALCHAENENLETPKVLTADFVYMRLRRPDYSESELMSIEYRVQQYLANGYPTYAIFKHEETPEGALNAERLWKVISEKEPAPTAAGPTLSVTL